MSERTEHWWIFNIKYKARLLTGRLVNWEKIFSFPRSLKILYMLINLKNET